MDPLKENVAGYDFHQVNNYYGKQVFTSQQQFTVAFEQFEAIYLAYNEVEHGRGSLTGDQNE